MNFRTKLAVFNAISKLLIIAVFVLLVPVIINKVALNDTDKRLKQMKENTFRTMNRVGINEFIKDEQDSSFASYNILKEEFISLEIAKRDTVVKEHIENTERNIEDDIVDYRVLSLTFKTNNQTYYLEVAKSIETIQDLNDLLKKLAIYILIIALTLTTLLDISFTGFLLRPFTTIVDTKLKATEHPDTFVYSDIKTSTTDFKHLNQSINELMEKMKQAFLSEKEFIANVSHELLTPVSILQNRLENMLADPALPHESALKIIESQKTLGRLSKIIKALLLISKIENDQYLKEDKASIKDLLTEVRDEIEDRLELKNIHLETNYAADFVMEKCNHSLLFNMFFNILNNAIKYNVQNGKIRVITGFENERFYVEIIDTGIGIKENNLPLIFTRFKRLQKDSNDGESFGLGLPIVKTVADFHRIKISVQSTVGQGTSFKLFFES